MLSTLQHDEEMEAYNEDEVEALQAADAAADGPGGAGDGGAGFIKMLQS
jgi:hypothetical protein